MLNFGVPTIKMLSVLQCSMFSFEALREKKLLPLQSLAPNIGGPKAKT
jgi:hypothetical protein